MDGQVPSRDQFDAQGRVGWVEGEKGRGPGRRGRRWALQGPGGDEKGGANGRDLGKQETSGLATEYRAGEVDQIEGEGCQRCPSSLPPG